MSIYGISGSKLSPGATLPTAAAATQARAARDIATAQGTRPPVTIATPTTQGGAVSAGGALPTQAPPGTDPVLWSVLSAEERAFFGRLGAMGPLTYGRAVTTQAATSAPALRGGRLDLKV